MKSNSKIFDLILYTAVITVILGIGFFAWLFWHFPSCDENSEAVEYARTLTTSRLEQLYKDMDEYSIREDIPIDGYQKHRDGSFPSTFADLNVIKIRPADGKITIKGCFDHSVMLEFHGIGIYKKIYKDKKIVLKWGEGPSAGEQVLWAMQ